MAGVLASEADRERCARLLHAAYADGRLTVDELERRLERVERAESTLELALVVRDVPKRRLQRVGAAVDRLDRLALKAHGATVVVVNGSLIGIWELTGGGAFWPAIALVPTSVLLGWHALSSWTVRRFVRRRRFG
ncbi:MAG: DUF1707 domain-containing protein [Solirubrobacteraceae bacterium]|nr:DUF1707 domain-containing protein [Solirubrobacteraceae bacterium]